MSRPIVDRFWEKVDLNGPIHPVLGTPCWLWTGKPRSTGYGQISLGPKSAGQVGVHRLAFEIGHGPLPPGMEPDHLCHTLDESCPGGACLHRLCVNWDHMEAVTHQENMRRSRQGRRGLPTGARQRAKTHCPKGHPYDEANTYNTPDGKRACRACKSASRKKA